MSMTYIMYMTPTFQEARRIGLMAKRLHGKPLGRCVMIAPFAEGEEAIYREPQHGKPRVRCFFKLATQNPGLAYDKHAWERAVELYDTRPYWIAFLQSVWESRFRRQS